MMSEKRKYQLALLQIEQYDTRRYLSKSRGKINHDLIERLRWTGRARATAMMSIVLGVMGANVMIAGVMVVVERLVWLWVRGRVRDLKKNGLRVVGIVGSYGKTSVKHNTYEILRTKYRVVATPESYNTVLGIAKCLYWEVDDRVELFLVEMGAYQKGDIMRLARMVEPDVGVLTGIARQHLERFGSHEKIKESKGEIAEYIQENGGKLVANGSDEVVREVVEKIVNQPVWYEGDGREEINLNGARTIAELIGMNKGSIMQARIRPLRSRFEMTTTRYGMKVIDDSYSSNDRGFSDAVKHLGKQVEYMRVLVTPGLVELGEESEQIHEELGREIVGNADLVILVGKSERTRGLKRGMAGKVKVIHIKKIMEFVQTIKNLELEKEPLVLLENDVTDNY